MLVIVPTGKDKLDQPALIFVTVMALNITSKKWGKFESGLRLLKPCTFHAWLSFAAVFCPSCLGCNLSLSFVSIATGTLAVLISPHKVTTPV